MYMDAKLQELTDKIYTEGVEKGKKEAAAIIAKAEADGDKMVKGAKMTADALIADAERRSAKIEENTKAELKLFAQQAVNALKTEVTDLICDKLVRESVKAATVDKAFMQKIIADFTAEWAKEGKVEINAKNAKELEEYFAANAKALLDKGVKINEVKGIKSEFEIIPAEGGYKVTFGEEEFVEYFKEFLRPKLVEMLF